MKNERCDVINVCFIYHSSQFTWHTHIYIYTHTRVNKYVGFIVPHNAIWLQTYQFEVKPCHKRT